MVGRKRLWLPELSLSLNLARAEIHPSQAQAVKLTS
jgi:hypothetical protein